MDNKKIDDIYNNKEKIIREYKEFEVRVKEDFLMESICKILIPSFDNLVDTPRKESICKGLVKDFIKDIQDNDWTESNCKYPYIKEGVFNSKIKIYTFLYFFTKI